MHARSKLVALLALAPLVLSAAPAVADPDPGDPAYSTRDLANIADAYGRIHGPGGQLRNPAYLPALLRQGTGIGVQQLLTQIANPTRLALTAGNVFPGWNVGNPLRDGWDAGVARSLEAAFCP